MGKLFVFLQSTVSVFNASFTVRFCCLFLCGLPLVAPAQVRVYNQGQAFSCIATDATGEIWAGTQGNGLWKLNRTRANGSPAFAAAFSLASDNADFNKYNLQTIAAGSSGHIWVGHNGMG